MPTAPASQQLFLSAQVSAPAAPIDKILNDTIQNPGSGGVALVLALTVLVLTIKGK
jgi:hypothetical protein